MWIFMDLIQHSNTGASPHNGSRQSRRYILLQQAICLQWIVLILHGWQSSFLDYVTFVSAHKSETFYFLAYSFAVLQNLHRNLHSNTFLGTFF